MAVAEDNATVMTLPAAELDIDAEFGGEKYRLAGVDSPVADALAFPVRLVESGRWLQRFDVERLILENDRKERLGVEGRLEVVAWPDVVSFSVELKPGRELADREIRLSCRLRAAGSSSSTTSSQSHLRARADDQDDPGEIVRETGGHDQGRGEPARWCNRPGGICRRGGMAQGSTAHGQLGPGQGSGSPGASEVEGAEFRRSRAQSSASCSRRTRHFPE